MAKYECASCGYSYDEEEGDVEGGIPPGTKFQDLPKGWHCPLSIKREDGGFSMAMADLVTTVKYDLPMLVVVLNNRQLAMIQVEQRMERFPNFGTDLLNPDFVTYAQACGCTGIKVRTPSELAPALRKGLGENRPMVVDIDTDPRRFPD